MATFKIVMQVLLFLINNKQEIIEFVTKLQTLFPSGTGQGSTKLTALKNYIALTLGLGETLESIWKVVEPLIEGVISDAKASPVTPK